MGMKIPGPEHERIWLRELKASLHRLAMDATDQERQFPPSCMVADELATEFGDNLRVCIGNGYLDGHPALGHLQALDSLLEQMSGPEQAERWTLDALETDTGWREVRRRAREAIGVAAWAGPPPPAGGWWEEEHPGVWKRRTPPD